MDKRQKILIVDDSNLNRDILKEILGDTYNYLEAENGNQAIQMIGENIGIDLMLLDINMPQMNGFEVLEIMKRSQCIAETPVIMISSEDAVDTMRKAYELGITDYITRPFDSVIVKKRVQNTLGLYMNQKHLINVVYDQVYEKEENNNIMIQIMSNILGSRNSESREHILHIKIDGTVCWSSTISAGPSSSKPRPTLTSSTRFSWTISTGFSISRTSPRSSWTGSMTPRT